MMQLIKINEEYFKSDRYFEQAYIFSVNIGVNQHGVVDTVLFSNETSKRLNEIFDFNQIRKNLMNNGTFFNAYKNEILVLLVSLIRGDTGMIQLRNSKEYLEDWKNVAKTSHELYKLKRPQLFLNPRISSMLGKYKLMY
ncbi:hypothetical protein D9M68_490300 [compost metagenome]